MATLLVPALRVSLGQPAPNAFAAEAQQKIAIYKAVDAGAMPASAPLELTLRLASTASQRADLQQLLAAQLDQASPDYHRWLTPEQFASRFGISDDQLSALTSWLAAQGLNVTATSRSRQSVTVTGTVAAAEAAFGVSLRRYNLAGMQFFANNAPASVRSDMAALITGIAGLNDLPEPAATHLTITAAGQPPTATDRLPQTGAGAQAATAASQTSTASVPTSGPLEVLARAIDANSTPVLSLVTAACSSDLTPAQIAGYRALLEQAASQGITVLANSNCSIGGENSIPAALDHAIAFTTAPREAPLATAGIDPRPLWQAASGLPSDAFRHEPDLTTTSGTALTQAVATLVNEQGTRLGNIGGILYALAGTPGLYTQPDSAPAGTWEPATGLGHINLEKLLKAFPRISGISTKTSLISTSYAVNYGNPFTLTSNVQVTGYIPPGTATNPTPPAPTGIVTFTASTQGVLGTTGIDGSGTASLDSGVLPVGSYVLTASYSGDAYYAPSSSTSNVTITVSLVNATLMATLSPATNIPYGAAATVTATVTLPGSSAAPTGPVSAQISSGAPVSQTLSPNPGSNSATTNIDVSVPPPRSYNVHVTCQGTTNFQCQTPVNIPITTVKGYTTTTVSVTPAAPQAGQPISLTATVVNSGNGTASYVYGGSITFYDSGRLLAVAPVATNQATTSVTLSGNHTHNLTAVYTGDANWNTSTSGAVAVTPTILPDALTLASNVSGSSSLAGVNIIFTGTVTTNITYSSGPTGTLTFFDTFNGAVVPLGNPSTLVANGSAASIALFTTTGMLPGTHHIYVQYAGDDNYAPAISPVLTLSLSDFSLTMTPTALTVAQGKSAQVGVLVSNSGGFTGTVTLGCTPPSGSEATCTFSPAAVTGAGATTLTISTAASQLRHGSPRARLDHPVWRTVAGISLAGVLFLFTPRRFRRVPALLIVLLGVSLAGGLGCGLGVTASPSGSGSGSTGGSPVSDPGTPLGTENYTITAAGSDGVNTVRHTYQYQVTIQ